MSTTTNWLTGGLGCIAYPLSFCRWEFLVSVELKHEWEADGGVDLLVGGVAPTTGPPDRPNRPPRPDDEETVKGSREDEPPTTSFLLRKR